MTARDNGPDRFEDSSDTFTRVVSKSFELEGVTFFWWCIDDDNPAFVTVSSRSLGSRADVTSSDPEAFARKLAGQLLDERRRRAAAMRNLGKGKA